jgi:ELWxxDGT repeat protein
VAGVRLVKAVSVGHVAGFSQAFDAPMIDVNGTLFFNGYDGVHGSQLWETNGTAAGTTMVTSITNTAGPDPEYLTNVAGTLMFVGWASKRRRFGLEVQRDRGRYHRGRGYGRQWFYRRHGAG